MLGPGQLLHCVHRDWELEFSFRGRIFLITAFTHSGGRRGGDHPELVHSPMLTAAGLRQIVLVPAIPRTLRNIKPPLGGSERPELRTWTKCELT